MLLPGRYYDYIRVMPYCGNEVELKNAKKLVSRECPVCKKMIMPGSLCDSCECDNECGKANIEGVL